MYEVIKTVGLRPSPTMYNSSIKNIPAGTKFESAIIKSVPEFGGMTFVYYEMGTDKGWLPMVYNGVVYVKDLSIAPPPPPTPTGTPFNMKVSGHKLFEGVLEKE